MYLGNWEDSKYDGMMSDFEVKDDKWKDINVIFAIYTYGCYDGNAYVLFEKDGSLYEVEGGHCSCYGLEGQWDPEETDIEVIRHRIKEGRLGDGYYDGDKFADELSKRLDELEL